MMKNLKAPTVSQVIDAFIGQHENREIDKNALNDPLPNQPNLIAGCITVWINSRKPSTNSNSIPIRLAKSARSFYCHMSRSSSNRKEACPRISANFVVFSISLRIGSACRISTRASSIAFATNSSSLNLRRK